VIPGLGTIARCSGGVAGCVCTPAFVTGDRRSRIIASTSFTAGFGTPADWVDGSTSAQWYVSADNTPVSGQFFKFDFGVGKKIKVTAARVIGNDASSTGTFKWQGSDDDSSWIDIGSNFTFQTSTTQTITTLGGNMTGYRFYRMLGVSGTLRWNYINEFEFEECECP
jgi:hypothetical protein